MFAFSTDLAEILIQFLFRIVLPTELFARIWISDNLLFIIIEITPLVSFLDEFVPLFAVKRCPKARRWYIAGAERGETNQKKLLIKNNAK